MAVSVAVIVANIYYAQPLLADIAGSFGLTVPQVASVAMLTQLGAAVGMVLFVPLGDTRERRALIISLQLVAAIALCFTAAARNLAWLCAASVAVGGTASTVHLIVPFAAHLAPTGRRGKVVGSVLGGLLMGILLARTFSGLIGAHFGWRAVYWIAAAIMLMLAATTKFFLPRSVPEVDLSYPALLRSIADLVRTQPALRESAFVGATFFCAFSVFWTTLVFLLRTPPYHYGSQTAGLFGLVGAVGAAGAPIFGRLADRHGTRTTVAYALGIALVSFVVLGVVGKTLAGLVVGVVLLDLGVQAGHVANQTRIYNLVPSARSRLNTFYMVTYFIGGALGSMLGAFGWRLAGWTGVCAAGFLALTAGLVYFARHSRNHGSPSN